MGQSVNRTESRTVNNISLESALEQFLYSSPHRSPRTIQTLQERLLPFIAHLRDRIQIVSPLEINRAHVDDFLRQISKGRRGKPLSESSVFGFAKDVQAFINYVADNLAPEDWPNPVRKMKLRRPQTRVRPLSKSQLADLFTLVDSQARTHFYRVRNRAMLMVPDFPDRLKQ